MGKASSAKKVARVARSSGGPRRERVKLGFPSLIIIVMVLGAGLVFWARESRDPLAAEPTIGDHWHSAYGIYICDEFEPPLTDIGPDRTGLHTHNDGLVHVHPFSTQASGPRATWAVFGEMVGLEVGVSDFTLPDGRSFEDGYDCDGEEAEVVLAQWPAGAGPDDEPTIHDGGFDSVRFQEDGEIFTLAVVPDGAEVPQPPSVEVLTQASPGIENPETGVDPEAVPEELQGLEDLDLPSPGGESENQADEAGDSGDASDEEPADDDPDS